MVSVSASPGMAAPRFACRDGARHQGRGGERARRVMHQDDARRLPFQRLQPGAHRTLARRAAEGGRADSSPALASAKRAASSRWITGCTKSICRMADEQRKRGESPACRARRDIVWACRHRRAFRDRPRPPRPPPLPVIIQSLPIFPPFVRHLARGTAATRLTRLARGPAAPRLRRIHYIAPQHLHLAGKLSKV